jgi:hypothetical protein
MFVKATALLFGVVAAAIGCYGAYDYAFTLEGHVSYLVVAAPVVAVAAAFAPWFAEQAWQGGHRVKAVLWCLVLIPTAATVFFAATERVHNAKAGAEAERQASRGAVALAAQALRTAERKLDAAEADARKARALPRAPASKAARPGTWCDSACLARWDTETEAARQRVAEARERVTTLEAKAPRESSLKLPAWVLPTGLDAFAWLALWTGLAWPLPKPKAPARRRRRTAKRPKAGPAAPTKAPPLRVVAGTLHP